MRHSCGSCRHGIISQPPLRGDRPIHIETLAQFKAGLIEFCSCEHGQSRQTYLTAALMAEETRLRQIADAPRLAEQRRMTTIFKGAGVPERYAAYTFETFLRVAGNDPGKREAIATIRSYFDAGQVDTAAGLRNGIFLFGPSGVGKTGSLSPLFVALLKQGHSGLWIQYNDLMAEMRRFEDGRVDERMDACKHVEYLFIDDFGDPAAQKTATDYARDVVFRIIDHRVSNCKPLLITSNLTLTDIENQFHARIARRIKTGCAAIQMGGNVLP